VRTLTGKEIELDIEADYKVFTFPIPTPQTLHSVVVIPAEDSSLFPLTVYRHRRKEAAHSFREGRAAPDGIISS
jgi:hypothetical protein